MSKNILTACPYCNQVLDSNGKTFTSKEDAEEFAIEQCRCIRACEFREKKEALQKAQTELMRILDIGDDPDPWLKKNMTCYCWQVS